MLPKFDNNEKFPAKLVGSWTTQYGELDQVGEIHQEFLESYANKFLFIMICEGVWY